MYQKILLCIGLLLIFFPGHCFASDEDLAKKSQNPVGNMVSLPLEYWHHDGMAQDGSADALILKPVYPVGIGSVTLINRFILPYVGIDVTGVSQSWGNIEIPPISSKGSEIGRAHV